MTDQSITLTTRKYPNENLNVGYPIFASTKEQQKQKRNSIKEKLYTLSQVLLCIPLTNTTLTKKEQLPGTLHTVVCTALEVSEECKLCIP